MRAARIDGNGLDRYQRYKLRKAGFDIPKLKAGGKPVNIWDHVDKTCSTGCWLWTGRLNVDGYGHFTRNYKTTMAHRAVWEELVGPIPAGLILRHSCDTPACCNPAHLLPGTQADNIADKVARNRQAKGSAVGSSKLTEQDVAAIRAAYIPRVVRQIDLAAQYGVSLDLIHKIVTRKYWTHVA